MKLRAKPASWWISVLLNPNTFQLIGFEFFVGHSQPLWWVLGPLFLLILPLAGYLYYTLAILRRQNPFVVSASERTVPFLLNLVCLVIAYLLIPDTADWGSQASHWETPFWQENADGFLLYLIWVNLLSFLLTQLHKTSLHVISAAALVGYAAFDVSDPMQTLTAFSYSPMVLLALGIPAILIWARYRQRAHTVGQLSSALLLGLLAGFAFHVFEVYLWLL